METLEEETIFENGWMRVNKLDFLFDLGKRSLIFVEKSRTGLPSKGEVWSGDPVVCDGIYFLHMSNVKVEPFMKNGTSSFPR